MTFEWAGIEEGREYALTAMEEGYTTVPTYWRDEPAGYVRFTLDGVTYEGVESPDDGYRSSLGTFLVVPTPIANTFPAQRVTARAGVKPEGDWYSHEERDTLELVSVRTGRVVIEVGTHNIGDYYPSYVGSIDPSALGEPGGVWQEVWSEDWYAQERHDMPEEYGTTSLLVNMVNGERVWRDMLFVWLLHHRGY